MKHETLEHRYLSEAAFDAFEARFDKQIGTADWNMLTARLERVFEEFCEDIEAVERWTKMRRETKP